MLHTFAKHRTTIILLVLCTLIAISLHLFYFNLPPLNSDEAAHGYNAYSIMKTGRGEFGELPIRFASFGEQKLPITAFLMIPGIAIFGLHDWVIRLPTHLAGITFPILFFFLTTLLTRSKRAGLLSALFAATSPWLQVTSRHAHEGIICLWFILVSIIATIVYIRKRSIRFLFIATVCAGISLWTYHIAKIYVVIWLIGMFYEHFLLNHQFRSIWIGASAIGFVPFFISELVLPTNRVGSLFFFHDPLFIAAIEYGRNHGGSVIFYNRYVYAVYELIRSSVVYFTPQFITQNGDFNPRFGSPGIGPLSIVVYLGLWIGLSRVFKLGWRKCLITVILLLVSIAPAVLAWQKDSVTRSLLICISWIVLAGYGWDACVIFINRTFFTLAGTNHARVLSIGILVLITLIHINQDIQSWDTYYQSYLDQKISDYPWQAGSKELAEYVWREYPKYKQFVVTKRQGQPYIYLLFYGEYDPHTYQRMAKHTAYNQYSFWENPGFDKFIFPEKMNVIPKKNTLYIVYPDELPDDMKSKADPIRYNGRDIFYAFTYEPPAP
ncbi:MAG: glycosyltransferase family 39 protein [Candidatus Roizmanbacteria bacterium]